MCQTQNDQIISINSLRPSDAILHHKNVNPGSAIVISAKFCGNKRFEQTMLTTDTNEKSL